MRQTAGVNRTQIAAIEQRGQTHSERNRPARAAMPTAREGNAVTGTRCQTRARATRQQKRTAERARGQRGNRNAPPNAREGNRPARTATPNTNRAPTAPARVAMPTANRAQNAPPEPQCRARTAPNRAVSPDARQSQPPPPEPPRQPRSSPRPNSAFPRRSPARTHACAGAKTGRHLSPRRLTIC